MSTRNCRTIAPADRERASRTGRGQLVLFRRLRAVPMQRLAVLPPAIRIYLSEFVARWRRLVVLRAIGWAVAVFLIWLLLSCAADRVLHLRSSTRMALLWLGSVTSVLTLLFPMRRLRGPVDWVGMADHIERQNPRFGQRLVTVTSRLLGEADYRGSDEILSHLLREVNEQAEIERSHRLLPARGVVRPWALSLGASLIMLGLWHMPVLGLPQLMLRLVRPMAPIPPVTTTVLAVSPGDQDVLPADAVRIEVQTQRLGDSAVWLNLNDDGVHWSRSTMEAVGDGEFALTLSAVDRDVRYYVTGGDAASSQYLIRVRRPPAVAQFRIRYTYPAYTGRPPFTVMNSTGLIEAPVGSEAILSVVATEPLQSAMVTIGNDKIVMDPGEQPNVRQAQVVVRRSMPYELDLISSRDVHGAGPEKTRIVATVDRPPLVRLYQGNQSLRLSPGDIIPLSYQALDDFGLDSLTVLAQINDAAPVKIPLTLFGDRRHQEDVANFDLAKLKLAMGDLVTVTLEARDNRGQPAESEPLQVLISPRAIDFDFQARINELNGAAQLASMLVAELDAARSAIDEASAQKDHQSAAFESASARANRHLSAASEVAAMLRQPLLRTIAHSQSSDLTVILSSWVDVAQVQADLAEDLFQRGGGPTGAASIPPDRLARALEQARGLERQLHTVAQGERASAVLLDRDNLQASRSRPLPTDRKAAERRAESLHRAEDEIAAGEGEIGVDPKAADAEAQLHSRVDAETALLRAAKPIDFAAEARKWSGDLQRDHHNDRNFDVRLGAAAQAEAVRPDADLIRARDLEVASRAAANLETRIADGEIAKPAAAGLLKAFADAMAALQHEHELHRLPTDARRQGEVKLAHANAAKARQEIAKWAGDAQPAAPTRPGAANLAKATAAEDLALRASAEAATRNYGRAAELDRVLVHQLADAAKSQASRGIRGRQDGRQNRPEIAAAQQHVQERVQRIEHAGQAISRSMTTAEVVDQLGKSQEQLQQEARAARRTRADELIGRQRAVALNIAKIEQETDSAVGPAATQPSDDDPNWRGRATAALLMGQEELAGMPQELAAVQSAATARRDADARARAAQADADSAGPDMKDAYDRAAEQADQDASDAATRLQKALEPVSPQAASDLADRLKPFAPEASSAARVIAQDLLSSLQSLHDQATGNDRTQLDRAVSEALKAIDSAQTELARAQDAFMQRDPLVSAKWFARAAADSLAQSPVDFQMAQAHQTSVAIALSRAWDQSIHRAATLRLSMLPSLQTVYGPSSATERTPAVATPNPSSFTASREWGRLHSRESDDLSSSLSNPDPPGYEEPLRLYFEALQKAQSQSNTEK